MQRVIILAVIVLVLQIGLVIAIHSGDQGFEPYIPDEKVVSFSVDAVDTVVIRGVENEVQLGRKDSGWLVVGSQGVPADGDRLEQFLQAVAGLKPSLAVATSKEAAKRFKVAKDSYASHLLLKQGEAELANLYFGTSPAFKQTHMRAAGSDEIILVGLASHEVSAEVSQWIDKNLLAIEKEKINAVKVKDISLVRGGEDSWQAEAGNEPGEIDRSAVDTLLEKISELSVSGYQEDMVPADDSDSFVFSITFADGVVVEYAFSRLDDTSYAVSRSDLTYQPIVSAWQVDALVEQIDKIVPKAEATAPVQEDKQQK